MFLSGLCFKVRVGVRLRDGVSFRVRDRVGNRDRVRVRCGFGFICFSSSKLELMICPRGEKQVHRIESHNITKTI